MGMSESRARYAGAHHSMPRGKAIHTLEALLADLRAGSDGIELKIYPGKSEHGQDQPWLCTEDGGVEGPGYDDFFPCPPRC